MTCAGRQSLGSRSLDAPRPRSRPSRATVLGTRSSMRITCTVIRPSPRVRSENWKCVTQEPQPRPKLEQNLQNDRQNGRPSPGSKSGKIQRDQLADDAVQCEPVSRGNNREKYRENPRPGPINCDLHPTCLDSSGLFASWRLEK